MPENFIEGYYQLQVIKEIIGGIVAIAGLGFLAWWLFKK